MDATSANVSVDAYSNKLQFDANTSIAYYSEAMNAEGLDPEIRTGVKSILDKLRNNGHTVNETSLSMLDMRKAVVSLTARWLFPSSW